jgi:hypothetical protein
MADFFHLRVIGGAGVVELCVASVSHDNLGCGDRPPLSGPDGTDKNHLAAGGEGVSPDGMSNLGSMNRKT